MRKKVSNIQFLGPEISKGFATANLNLKMSMPLHGASEMSADDISSIH